MNRLTTATTGGQTRTYMWDTCTHGIGRLCATDVSGRVSVGYSYTPEGWLTARAFSFTSGPTYTLAYAYDAMGHLAEVQYPDDNEALYDYTRGATVKGDGDNQSAGVSACL